MSVRSQLQSFVTMPTTAFSADRPVSAWRTYALRSNAQHLIDSSGQYLVNWHADLTSEGLHHDSGLDPSTPAYCSWIVPIRIVQAEHPMHYDIRVAAQLEAAGTALIAAILSPYGAPRAITGEEHGLQWFYETNTTTSTTGEWVLDERWTWSGSDRSYMSSVKSFGFLEDGVSRTAKVVLARLEILLFCSTAETEADITAVSLREYP